MVAIINDNAVPIAAPFSTSTATIGKMPAALEYRGMPIKVANGTAYQLLLPINDDKNSAGT
ncbi:MAG: hypothetical protein BWZ05_02278 [Bacteroidetes bacterium ADurb.BinA245]|nr:MAG: hypothetical protein BWZ05_02278 [Bacteroidetes bacterium ADurb.BinA245]